MYKNEPNYTARLSLEIISNFPKQAVILKNMQAQRAVRWADAPYALPRAE
jgi:hypothetical protein